ncbi:hypothetical protein OAS59_00190 [Pelagibacteraceae bacterium]|jgi:hypothetical protein|nr:hypothetical protein [Pelagibacteraceae bacterium]
MEQNIEKKKEFKDKIILFYNKKKILIYSIIFIFFLAFIIGIFYSENVKKKNDLIAEKYIKAGLHLTSNNKEKSKNLYEEIILSKNKFYSILALNNILENNLILNKNTILNYFQIVEKNNNSKEYKDLIILKKALYLIKIGNTQKGNLLLKNLIDNESKLKLLAEEILIK